MEEQIADTPDKVIFELINVLKRKLETQKKKKNLYFALLLVQVLLILNNTYPYNQLDQYYLVKKRKKIIT